MIKELIEFISRYDPEYPRKIHGASQAEILLLERLANRRLPRHYREFLEHMGNDMGDFVIPNSDFNLATVLGIYEDEEWPPHPGYLFIASMTQEPYENYHLESSDEDLPDRRVVRFSAEADLTAPSSTLVVYPSLSDMLFSWAFKDKRMSLLPAQSMLVPSLSRARPKTDENSANPLLVVGELAAKLGFQRLPYTSAYFPMYDKPDAAILGHQNPTSGGIYVDVAAETESTLKHLLQVLRDNTRLL